MFDVISRIALLGQERTYAWRGQNDAGFPFWASLLRKIHGEGGEVTGNVSATANNRWLHLCRMVNAASPDY
jgi:hypothetical protein